MITINVHFLNMLIAIMGNTFSERNDVAEKQIKKDHLRIVLDNWYLSKLAIRDKKRVMYIVTAFVAEEEKDEIEKLNELQEQIRLMD